ncbi:hypothetical protein [Streptomyces sp. NPDC057740]|uniref:hypothetical protein n=1 Tax=Streptomyces sp. NPDC057740 TaxID=3346234 RepID=UPI00367CCC75
MNRVPRWAPDWQCGPPERPEEYTLVSHLHTGGEGEVWRASRRLRDGGESHCALKILTSEEGDVTPEQRAAWRERWADSVHRRFGLDIPGLATPYQYFVGPVPRPARQPPSGAQILYLVSPWYDGTPADLWAESSTADAVARAEVLRALCLIVDRLHDLGHVHQDISGGNVLVTADGQVQLIDITFLAPLERELTLIPYTPGYAPEGQEEGEGEQRDGRPDPARDRFSVGAVARALLLPDLGPLGDYDAARMTHRQLVSYGYSVQVADCLVRALDPEPARRPAPLTDWAEELRDLLIADRDAPHTCVDVLPTGIGHPLVVTGGPSGLRWYGLPGRPSHRPSSAVGTPRGVRDVACLSGPHGGCGVAAVDARGALWLGTADRWRELAGDVRSIVALNTHGMPALLWAGHGSGVHLYRWLPGDEADPRPAPSRLSASTGAPAEVLAASRDRDGRPCVLVGLPDLVELWAWPESSGGPPHRRPVTDAPATRAALALNVWGELEAALLRPDGNREIWCDHFADGWLCMEESRPTGAATTDVALLGDRRLNARADAAPDGLTVSVTTPDDSSTWHITDPAHQVRLTRTGDGRLLAVYLAEGGPRSVWEEWTGTQGPVQRLQIVGAD